MQADGPAEIANHKVSELTTGHIANHSLQPVKFASRKVGKLTTGLVANHGLTEGRTAEGQGYGVRVADYVKHRYHLCNNFGFVETGLVPV